MLSPGYVNSAFQILCLAVIRFICLLSLACLLIVKATDKNRR